MVERKSPLERKYKEDPFIVDKVGMLVIWVWFTSLFSPVLVESSFAVEDTIFAFLIIFIFTALVVWSGIRKWRENNPGKILFPGDRLPGFFFYASLCIDLMIPFYFFVWIQGYMFDGKVSELIFALMQIPAFMASLLIFIVYALMFSYGFPRDVKNGARQFGARIFTLLCMLVFYEEIVDALFMYGLLEVVALSFVVAVFFLAHRFFKEPEGNADKVFKYDLSMIVLAVFFGLPLLLWALLFLVFGYIHLFSPTFDLPEFFKVIMWMGILFPVLISHFQSLRNYSIGFYRDLQKD